jgi:DNA modification methylase
MGTQLQMPVRFTEIPCTVVDPFGGSGTTGLVALELGRCAILHELNPEYAEIARNRTNITPGLSLS